MDRLDELKKEIVEQRGIRKSYNVEHGLQLIDIDNLKGKRVLEVACGEGNLSLYLSAFAESVVGVDIMADSVSIANKRMAEMGIENCEFVTSDILTADLDLASFDLIVGEAALHHIIYDFNIGARLYDLLKTGGRLVFITEPLAYNLFSEGIRFLRHHIKHAFGEFSLWFEHIAGFASKFDEINYYHFDIFSHPFKAFEKIMPASMFRGMMKILWRVDEFIFRNFKGLRKYSPNVNIEMVKK